MKRLVLATILSFTVLPALAQQAASDPGKEFESGWSEVDAASKVFDMMSRGLAQRASGLLAAYRKQNQDLEKAKTDLAASEAQKATLLEWLQQAQAKEAK